MPPADPAFDLDALCRLSRLAPAPGLRAELGHRIARVLAAFAMPPADGERPAEPTLPSASLRPDQEGACLPLAVVLGNAPRTAADCFLTPRVVEG